MTDVMIQNAIASSVVGLTQHAKTAYSIPSDEAYKLVYGSTLYHLLTKPETRLFLEPNDQLSALLDIEHFNGAEKLEEALI